MQLLGEIQKCSESQKCGLCQGDCDGDSGCPGILVCFRTPWNLPYMSVPGCEGRGVAGKTMPGQFQSNIRSAKNLTAIFLQVQTIAFYHGRIWNTDGYCFGVSVCFWRPWNQPYMSVPGCKERGVAGKTLPGQFQRSITSDKNLTGIVCIRICS